MQRKAENGDKKIEDTLMKRKAFSRSQDGKSLRAWEISDNIS